MSVIDITDSKPKTAAEALARWDAGDIVWTAEMGGLGPGYEQCIHVMAFEIVRELLAREPIDWALVDAAEDNPEAKHMWHTFTDSVEAAVMPRIAGLGSSGAQWGAAQNLAYIVVRKGWAAALSELPDDRLTQVSRAWPKVEQPVSVAAVDPVATNQHEPTTRE